MHRLKRAFLWLVITAIVLLVGSWFLVKTGQREFWGQHFSKFICRNRWSDFNGRSFSTSPSPSIGQLIPKILGVGGCVGIGWKLLLPYRYL